MNKYTIFASCLMLSLLMFSCGDSSECEPCNDEGQTGCFGNISMGCDGSCWQPVTDCGNLTCMGGSCVAVCNDNSTLACPVYNVECATYETSGFKATGCCEGRCCSLDELRAACPEL